MGQSLQGAKKAAATNLAKDPDFYRKIGSVGGKAGKIGYFSTISKRELKRIGSEGGKAKARNFNNSSKEKI